MMLNLSAAARMLSNEHHTVSARWVRRLVETGKLPAKKINGRLYTTVAAVEAFLAPAAPPVTTPTKRGATPEQMKKLIASIY